MSTPPPLAPRIQRRDQKQGPLSYSQESMWFLQQLDPENSAYNLTFLYKISGGIDRLLLEQALNEVVRRHEILRTVFPNQGGKAIQVIQPFISFSLPYLDFSNLPEDERQQAVQRYASEHGNQRYDLQRGPLVRYALLHSSSTEDYLFFGTHHIGFDGWSRKIFFSELMLLYDAFCSGNEPALPPLPIQYADYALWQREWLSGETLATFIEHWKNILSGDLPILELHTDRPRPTVQTYRSATYHFNLPQTLTTQMGSFCQRERITPFQLLLAGFALMLMRHSGQEDIIIGCPFANRIRPEFEGSVGNFVNTLPLRINMSGRPSVRELLAKVRTLMLDALIWQAAPFESLVSAISPERDLNRAPVFQVVINLRNIPKRQTIIGGLEAEGILKLDGSAQFDLWLEFEDDRGSLDASFCYNIDLFDESTIIHMAAHFQNLIRELLVKADRPIVELEMLTPSEFKRIVYGWNDTWAEFPQVCLQDLCTEQAEKHPNAPAVICYGKTLKYGELETKSNQIAHYLRLNGVKAEDRIGIYLPRSERMIITLLGILKAGAAYVPLDLTHPADRTAYIVKDSNPIFILTLGHLCSQLPDQITKICLDVEAKTIDACESGKLISITDNNSLAYVMYTSGSTGRPKGAMNVHKGVVNYLTYITRRFHFNASDRVIQLTSLSFDVSAFEIFSTLLHGGTLYLMDDDQMRDPDFILTSIIDHHVTILSMVPTMLRAICESALAGEQKNNTLRLIMPVGEILRDADVKRARQVFGDSAELVNQYGPTECSIIHTIYSVPEVLPSGLQIVPIGKPIDNARAYILDQYLHPIPQGGKGELIIGGVGVGRGYWNQPDLTAERFLPDPFLPGGRVYRTGDLVRQLPDGTICFLGRSDDQVKIRGYRVELGEIEAVMNEFQGVKDAVVVLLDENGAEALAGYVTFLQGYPKQILENLHAYLAERLPFYMVPGIVSVLEEIPLTPNGKIDRKALPSPDGIHIKNLEYIAPRNKIENVLSTIWMNVLNIPRVSVEDNFFYCGGNSLLAIRVIARIQEELELTVPVRRIFEFPRLSELAGYIEFGLLAQKQSLDPKAETSEQDEFVV